MEATLEPNTRKKLPNDRKMTGRFEFKGVLYLTMFDHWKTAMTILKIH